MLRKFQNKNACEGYFSPPIRQKCLLLWHDNVITIKNIQLLKYISWKLKLNLYISTLNGTCNNSSVTTLLWELQFIKVDENREISRYSRFFTVFENVHNVQLFEIFLLTYNSTYPRLLKTITELHKSLKLKVIPN